MIYLWIVQVMLVSDMSVWKYLVDQNRNLLISDLSNTCTFFFAGGGGVGGLSNAAGKPQRFGLPLILQLYRERARELGHAGGGGFDGVPGILGQPEPISEALSSGLLLVTFVLLLWCCGSIRIDQRCRVVLSTGVDTAAGRPQLVSEAVSNGLLMFILLSWYHGSARTNQRSHVMRAAINNINTIVGQS